MERWWLTLDFYTLATVSVLIGGVLVGAIGFLIHKTIKVTRLHDEVKKNSAQSASHETKIKVLEEKVGGLPTLKRESNQNSEGIDKVAKSLEMITNLWRRVSIALIDSQLYEDEDHRKALKDLKTALIDPQEVKHG